MNIVIGSNSRQILMNSIGKNSNSRSSAMEALIKEKGNLQDQIKTTSQNKNLSQAEKTQKLSELQKQMDELNQRVGQQQLEDMKNSREEVAENMTKKAEKATTDEQKEENAGVALNYSLISATTDSKDIKKLTGYRKTAIKEEGPNSSRVKRIDNIIGSKADSIKENLSTMARAIQEYSKSKKEESEERIKEKTSREQRNADDLSVENNINLDNINGSIKADSRPDNVSNEVNNTDAQDKDRLSDEQIKEKKFKRRSINIHI